MRVFLSLAAATSLAVAARALNLRARSAPPPAPPFRAVRKDFPWRGNSAVVWQAGEGPPILLLHGVYAGASAYEWRHVAPALAQAWLVCAPDLPGFGASSRSRLHYRSDSYVQFLQEIRARQFPEPPIVVASTLSAAFAVGAAASCPAFASRLVLICPTGLEALSTPAGRSREILRQALTLPGLGDLAVVLLGRRRTVARYLRNYTYFDESRLDPDAVGYIRAQVLQPGARHALAAFLSGALNRDVREDLARLAVPVDIVWGRQAEFTPIEQANAFLQAQPAARLHIVERCGNAPQMERPREFLKIIDGLRALR